MSASSTPPARTSRIRPRGATILYIARRAHEALFVREVLCWGGGYATTVCDDLDEARIHLAHQAFDLVLVDYFLEDGVGTELLRALRDEGLLGVARAALMTSAAIRAEVPVIAKPTAEADAFIATVDAVIRTGTPQMSRAG